MCVWRSEAWKLSVVFYLKSTRHLLSRKKCGLKFTSTEILTQSTFSDKTCTETLFGGSGFLVVTSIKLSELTATSMWSVLLKKKTTITRTFQHVPQKQIPLAWHSKFAYMVLCSPHHAQRQKLHHDVRSMFPDWRRHALTSSSDIRKATISHIYVTTHNVSSQNNTRKPSSFTQKKFFSSFSLANSRLRNSNLTYVQYIWMHVIGAIELAVIVLDVKM